MDRAIEFESTLAQKIWNAVDDNPFLASSSTTTLVLPLESRQFLADRTFFQLKRVSARYLQHLLDLNMCLIVISRRRHIPGVIGSTVNGSSPDETGRLVIEGCPADRTAQTSRVPRPAGHLNQEAVGNQFTAGSANSSRDTDLAAGSGADQAANNAATGTASDASDSADPQAAGRIDRTVGRRWSFGLNNVKNGKEGNGQQLVW